MAKKIYTLRSAEEAKTHELFGEYLKTNWTTATFIVSKVFTTMWTSALPIERINAIGTAIAGDRESSDFSAALTALVRAKVLRSYRKLGKVLYEVNY